MGGLHHPAGSFLEVQMTTSSGILPPHQNSQVNGESRNSQQYMQTIILQKAVVPVPESKRYSGFYSPVFLVRKKQDDKRPVLDLKGLNRFILLEHFKMESLNTVISAVQPGDWMVSIDFQDAYLHSQPFSGLPKTQSGGHPPSVSVFPVRYIYSTKKP